MFPFLIGTVRTVNMEASSFLIPLVSIPHRYGKNEKGSKSRHNRNVFPFLIGTVRTRTHCWYRIRCCKFPFLIGTVRTCACHRELYTLHPGFPFLIGTVRTQILPSNLQDLKVSIPHRYGKNRWGVVYGITLCGGFPFLIGTVRTKSRICPFSASSGVSIPHRYGKNGSRYDSWFLY